MNDDKLSSIVITNISEEMYNDGLYFLEQVEKETDQFIKWRFQRVAIISFAVSFESLVNRFIIKKLKESKELNQSQKCFLKFLEEGKGSPKKFKTVKDKLNLLEKLCELDAGVLNNKYKRDLEVVVHMRNNIMHYSHGKFSDVYGEEIDNISRKSSDILRSYLGFLCEKINEVLPEFYLRKEYIPIN